MALAGNGRHGQKDDSRDRTNREAQAGGRLLAGGRDNVACWCFWLLVLNGIWFLLLVFGAGTDETRLAGGDGQRSQTGIVDDLDWNSRQLVWEAEKGQSAKAGKAQASKRRIPFQGHLHCP